MIHRALPFLLTLALVAIVSACGDGDGDGQPTPTATPTPEATPTAFPQPTPPPNLCDFPLTEMPPDLTVYGADADDFLGDRFSLASGDFNGDGQDDLLIGAPKADGPDNARTDAGEAYVIFGRESPPPTIDLADDAADITLLGEEAGDNFGFTLAAGDFNGDGTDDIIVGARFAAYQGDPGVGKAYVVFGGADLPATIDSALGDQDVTVVGRDAGDFAAVALATGDVDGDGADDLIIGASSGDGPDGTRVQSGEVYVVGGGSDLPALIELSEDEPLFTVFGAEQEDQLPNSVATGDLDGDGRDELLLGAPLAEGGDEARPDAGEAYIVPVPMGGGSLDLASGQGFSRVTGAATRDGLGFFLTTTDVNGDGVDDAVIGARDADGRGDQRNNSGEVHILFGSSDLPESLDLAVAPADITLYGAGPDDSLGFTVAAGDTDGDGIGDVLAGAPLGDGCDGSQEEAGELFVIQGRRSLPEGLDLAGGGFDVVRFGLEAGDELAFSLASGDFNGDGKDDIFAGALLADGPEGERVDAGEVYVILSP